MISTLIFTFEIIRPIIFSAVKKVTFPQSRKFSTVKNFFSTVKDYVFPQSRRFSAVKEILNSQGNFTHSMNISTVKKFFHSQRNFPQSRIFFHTQGNS